MYETKNHPLLKRNDFIKRMINHFLAVVLIIGLSLLIGMTGYWYFESHSWISAFMHTCFLLGGYGHLTAPQSTSGQIFLGFYGLYANLVFLTSLGVLFTPIVHRLLHTFHLEIVEEQEGEKEPFE